METFKEIYDEVANTTRETQIESLIKEWVNLSLMELNDPGWAFEQIGIRGYAHNWSSNRRKHSFPTVASTETYQLPRDLDKISLVRQTDSPAKIAYIPDEVFYRYIPDPTATGNPLYYRLWEEEGVSVRLSVDDKIKIVSSVADTAKVSIVGYSVEGFLQSEELTLNGATLVSGTLTYDAGRVLKVSKSAKTSGKVTVSEFTAGTTLVVLGPEERTARFKMMGLYPIPSSVITVYLEYFTRFRRLVNDTDVPDIDEKWIYVIRLGAIAKVREYQDKPEKAEAQAIYASAVRGMVKADIQNIDYIPHLLSQRPGRTGRVELGESSYGLTF
jgi:hypothetical protein